jgi:serine/threonine protein kinase
MVLSDKILFPPCTSDKCTVDEEEKRKVAAVQPCAMTEKCVSACSAYGRVCPCAARIAGHAACEAMQELMKGSKIFKEDERTFVHLDPNDITISEKLGEGGFSNVNRCVVQAGDEAGQEFAVKYLKRKAMVDIHQFKHGAADLAIEAFFLHSLDHPNIVKLHGVSAGKIENNVASGEECGFFIVVDRLFDTLESRIETFRKEQEDYSTNPLIRRGGAYREKQKSNLMERCRIALEIASAIEYLHSKQIIFRDLKPDNIGFDKHGTLKIFDFGLAKELKPELCNQDGRYRLTGNTGSRRYMAPEVAKDCPYDMTVDSYSFGILLWELCSAEKPFYGYSSGKHMQQVVLGGERPKMDSQHTVYWPENLQWIMTRCWSPFPSLRPSFSTISEILMDVLAKKESLPHRLLMHTINEEKHPLEGPVGGFVSLFSRKANRRSTTAGTIDDKSQDSEASAYRRKSWGFGMRR